MNIIVINFNKYINKYKCPYCYSNDRIDIIREESTYEGAIVFDPVAQIDYEANSTKDYASLYPSK